MRKFAANYVVSDSGGFLKNGILIADLDGTVLGYIDTEGHLEEVAQLEFHNGILIGAFNFIRKSEMLTNARAESALVNVLLQELDDRSEISVATWLEICKKIQEFFPDMSVVEIFEGVNAFLAGDGGYRKEDVPGVYLLTGTHLGILKLSSTTKLKRLL